MPPNTPTIFIIFGATGDLMKKKIAPALFYLFTIGKLPETFKIFGFARRDWNDQDFHKYVAEILEKHIKNKANSKKLKEFLKHVFYHQGLFDNLEDYQSLRKKLTDIDAKIGICSSKLFYLAVPPDMFQTIAKNINDTKLANACSSEEGWTKIIIEKPFGHNLQSAKELNNFFAQYFREEQMYRIDHYLGKEMIQDILSFRFSNNLFDKNWTNEHIEKIHIKLWETIGAEDRGTFYENVGALRDVGQNHLLSLLAFITMDHPGYFEASRIRKRRTEMLSKLVPPTLEEIKNQSYRGQYEGYRNIPGVNKDSKVETYFKIKAHIDDPRFWNIPITLEAGKRLAEVKKEIVITFKRPHNCFLCTPGMNKYKDKIFISWEPQEGIRIAFWSKKPGLNYELEEKFMSYNLRDKSKKVQYVEEYSKLLLDCIEGDQTLFLGPEEIEAMWKFTDPIRESWNKDCVPLDTYRPDTDEAIIKSKAID